MSTSLPARDVLDATHIYVRNQLPGLWAAFAWSVHWPIDADDVCVAVVGTPAEILRLAFEYAAQWQADIRIVGDDFDVVVEQADAGLAVSLSDPDADDARLIERFDAGERKKAFDLVVSLKPQFSENGGAK